MGRDHLSKNFFRHLEKVAASLRKKSYSSGGHENSKVGCDRATLLEIAVHNKFAFTFLVLTDDSCCVEVGRLSGVGNLKASQQF